MTTTKRIGNAYECRDQIKAAGGKYDGATRSWLVSDEQLAALVARAAESLGRSNKRDRAFGLAWQKVTISEVA